MSASPASAAATADIAKLLSCPTLTTLKATELKQVAFLTGLSSSSARKSGLVSCIAHGLHTPRLQFPRAPGSHARILSIDMGIRNLAYCVLDVSPSLGSSISSSPSSSLAELCSSLMGSGGHAQSSSSVLEHVKLHAWKRTALFPSFASYSSSSSREVAAAASAQAKGSAREETEVEAEADRENAKEKFDPASIAQHAYAFLAPLMQTHQPTQVLIERQRHRSNGMSAVLEWTVRVNMLESMFFAILETMHQHQHQHQRPHQCSAGVASVDPKRTASFWTTASPQPDSTAATTRRKGKGSRSGQKIEKEARIAIVESMLGGGTDDDGAGLKLQCSDGDAAGTRAAFLSARERRHAPSSRRRRASSSSSSSSSSPPTTTTTTTSSLSLLSSSSHAGQEEKKLDDLSDCLLQALAWAQWDTNRLALLQHFSQQSS